MLAMRELENFVRRTLRLLTADHPIAQLDDVSARFAVYLADYLQTAYDLKVKDTGDGTTDRVA